MRRFFTVAAVAASTMLFGTQAAVASPTVNWKEVNTNSNWTCNSEWKQHWIYNNVNFKSCIVTNSSGGAQGVLVVQNASTHTIRMKGRVLFESEGGGDVWCADTTLHPGYTRGCYAPTVQLPCWQGYTDGIGVTLYVWDGSIWVERQQGLAGPAVGC